jgi:hypothetical protein
MKKKGNVLNAPNTLTIKEDGKIDPVTYRRGAPSVTRTLPNATMYAAGSKPSRGIQPEDMPGSPRTMRGLPSLGLGTKKGGYEETLPRSPRTLRRLPASIADGGVD